MNKIKTILFNISIVFSLIISDIAFAEERRTYYHSFKLTHKPPVPTTEYDMYEFLIGLLIFFTAICVLFALFISYAKSKLKSEINKRNVDLENKILDLSNNTDPNVIRIMKVFLTNLSESTEFFQITKYQVEVSFGSAILSAIIGLIVFLITFFFVDYYMNIGYICSAFFEFIASIFLYIHNKSLNQLNFYYKQLSITEKYLLSIYLTNSNEIKYEDKIEILKTIINKMLSDNTIRVNNLK